MSHLQTSIHIIWMMALAKKESIYDLRRSVRVKSWRAFAARLRTKARKNSILLAASFFLVKMFSGTARRSAQAFGARCRS